jgi:imidazoleglycerol-phosphate dehydratase / histidinol-phosphatase
MKKVLFIDRDGTLVREPKHYEVKAFDQLEFYPYMFQYMGRIAAEFDYELVMVSNQDGLGSPTFTEEAFFTIHNFIMKCLENEGIHFTKVHIDRTFPYEKAGTRKPGIGMLLEYIGNKGYDIENSFVIGDRITDVQMAKNLNCNAIWLNQNSGLGSAELTDTPEVLQRSVVLETPHWKDIYQFLTDIHNSQKIEIQTG